MSTLKPCRCCQRLTHLGTATGGDPDDVRCIDCWFSPEPEHWVAIFRAVLKDGRTGDIVRREFGEDHFWPHDDSPDAWKTKPWPISEDEVAYKFPILWKETA